VSSCATQKAANESRAQIEAALQGTDMVFVTVSQFVPQHTCIAAAVRWDDAKPGASRACSKQPS